MSDLLEDFGKLTPNKKFAVIALILLTISIYPQILIISLMGIVIYIIITNTPRIIEEYNKGKSEVQQNQNLCTNCGTKVNENANFCPKCGSKMN